MTLYHLNTISSFAIQSAPLYFDKTMAIIYSFQRHLLHSTSVYSTVQYSVQAFECKVHSIDAAVDTQPHRRLTIQITCNAGAVFLPHQHQCTKERTNKAKCTMKFTFAIDMDCIQKAHGMHQVFVQSASQQAISAIKMLIWICRQKRAVRVCILLHQLINMSDWLLNCKSMRENSYFLSKKSSLWKSMLHKVHITDSI